MAYREDEYMRKIPWDEVKQILRKRGDLAGYFYLYDDGTEAMIDPDENPVNIIEHHEKGGEFGKEKTDPDARMLLRELHAAGGCDATDEFAKGWDAAISEAISIVTAATGVTIEEALDESPKKRVRFRFYKQFTVDAKLTEGEISHIHAKGGDLPSRVWAEARDRDRTIPVEFDAYEEDKS